MDFKLWLDSTVATADDRKSEKFFGQRDKIQNSNIGELLGFKKPLIKINQGSLATIYQHPENENQIIKVTSHKDDLMNLFLAQKLNSRNIVKLFTRPEPVPKMPKAFWAVEEKVNGEPMVYDTGSFIGLINGDRMESIKGAVKSIVYADTDRTRSMILDRFDKNNDEEYTKLSDLFETLLNLERMRISMVDFAQNILDDGDHYVIVDLGF